MLLAADYSQVELRILAHLSGDARLQALLSQTGMGGDIFCLIAASWLHGGNRASFLRLSTAVDEAAAQPDWNGRRHVPHHRRLLAARRRPCVLSLSHGPVAKRDTTTVADVVAAYIIIQL